MMTTTKVDPVDAAATALATLPDSVIDALSARPERLTEAFRIAHRAASNNRALGVELQQLEEDHAVAERRLAQVRDALSDSPTGKTRDPIVVLEQRHKLVEEENDLTGRLLHLGETAEAIHRQLGE